MKVFCNNMLALLLLMPMMWSCSSNTGSVSLERNDTDSNPSCFSGKLDETLPIAESTFFISRNWDEGDSFFVVEIWELTSSEIHRRLETLYVSKTFDVAELAGQSPGVLQITSYMVKEKIRNPFGEVVGIRFENMSDNSELEHYFESDMPSNNTQRKNLQEWYLDTYSPENDIDQEAF